MVSEEGVARLSLRPSMAPAFAAGLGADALPCVALFLLFVGAPRPFSFDAWVPEEGLARLSLAPQAVRCGVPQGAQFIREWGRPSRAAAFAAGLGTSALQSVALILANRSAFLARSTPS